MGWARQFARSAPWCNPAVKRIWWRSLREWVCALALVGPGSAGLRPAGFDILSKRTFYDAQPGNQSARLEKFVVTGCDDRQAGGPGYPDLARALAGRSLFHSTARRYCPPIEFPVKTPPP